MRVVRVKPPLKQIEALLENCNEALYLEGIDGLSKKEICKYHSKILYKNFKDDNFVVVSNEDGSFGGMAVFHNLDWDTKYLGLNLAKIDLIITDNKMSSRGDIYRILLNEIFSTCRAKAVKLVFFRNSINNKVLNKFMAIIDACPISVLVNLYYSFDREKDEKDYGKKFNIQIRRPKKFEYRQIEELMAEGFKNKLFYEKLFKKEDVKNLYREWAKNDLNGRVKEVLVAIVSERITGFVALDQLCIDNKKYGFIDMLVVDEKFRKKGIGTILMNEAAKRLYKNKKGILLGTELDKPGVVNFYTSLGFHIVDSYYSYHINPSNR